MKHPIHIAFILCIAIMLTACGSEAEPQTQNGFLFTFNGIQITMKSPAEPIIAALGEPRSYTEETSCAFDGLDKTYFYGSFYLSTYPENGSDYVYRLWFADDGVATAEGICIGSTREQVETAYGAEYFSGENLCALTQGGTKLTILLSDGLVNSIQYEALLD